MRIHSKYSELEDYIKNKIRVLRQFGILASCTPSEVRYIRNILRSCKNECEVDRKVYNVLHGTETISSFIGRHQRQE